MLPAIDAALAHGNAAAVQLVSTAEATPRSRIIVTASSLNSRLYFLRCMLFLQFDKTPYLGVHQTGSRQRLTAPAPLDSLCEFSPDGRTVRA